jgi:Fe-S-cluster-containing hydrogenase component 2
MDAREHERNGYGSHVVQYPKEYSMCTGCKSCEIVCSLVHNGEVRISNRRITCELGNPLIPVHTIQSCLHCEDHPCYDACPKQGEAMHLDAETNIVYVDEARCIGCRLCQKACRFEPSRIVMTADKKAKDRRAKKCDLCRTRPEGPACVQWCPALAIGLSDEVDAPAAYLVQLPAVKG